ncbi:hypothetical protein KVR01_004507 [Diaporthe batatas]|uniref:uncharacterized protein n=1 Tax=Diaporthe batatas TaxID=748121 RepID=UPI001D044963|nr:uncharacterized protein KVR01_004507 [Diaporthe batatas]KAG8165955.1 hypothetical protein KVR01_004507 [Diaporthe batatas]
MLRVDEMAPVMDVMSRQQEKEVRAGLRRRYLRQRLAPIDTSLRAPRRDLMVVTTERDLRRQEDADEDDSDDDEAAATRQGTRNRQGKDYDSDDDDDEGHRQNQPVATLAVPEPETPSPTLQQTFPPPQLVPAATSTTLMALPSPTTPATPPTPTFPPLPPPPPPVITLPPTTVVMTSTVMATPRPSAVVPPVVNNPQVNPPSPTSTSISMMTTQPITLVSSISVSSQPRKGVGNPETTSSSIASPTSTQALQTTQTTPLAFENSTPSATPSFGDVRNGNDNGRDQDRGPPRGLDPTAEHALISAGSIGGFIIVCFICWTAWRMIKKSKARENGYYGNQPPPSNQLLAKIPYFGRGQRGWQEMGDGPNDMRSPSQYEKTNSVGQISEIYSMYDPRSQTQSMSKQGPMVLPQLQTNFSPAGNYSNNPFSATSGSIHNTQSASPQSQMSQQPLTNMPPQLQPGFSPASNFNPFLSNMSADGSNSMGPSNMLQYGSMQNTGTMQSVGSTQGMGTIQTVATTTTTDRSRMQDPFFNQSELARQPSDAYDPNRRQVYRASELSSLSSGFGDEDIIVPPPAATRPPGAPGTSRLSYQQTPGVSRKNSVANASEAGNSNRDTVYTTTSEDMPPRFRTVNSWVNQQTGRVRRAEQRANEEIPPVPSMPPEERYTMMMDDEEPRRPDATAAPVPALPTEFKDTKP